MIGGPGAFALPVFEWSQFAEAVKRKIVLEIAGLSPELRARVIPVQARSLPPYDCLKGEKLWERNRRYFELP